MRKLSLMAAFLLLPACEAKEGQQRFANKAESGATAAAVPATAGAPAPSDEAAESRLKSLSVGPVLVPYDSTLLTPVPAKIQMPPDWKTEVEGTKLVARERAAMLGKAGCMYGQSGKAATCNAEQEAGLAFADLEGGWIDGLRRAVPAGELKKITLGGVNGVSWQIGAEGEGAEYILLPVWEHTIVIVRHFRNTGNPDEAALGASLKGLKLPE